jgi:hypothetical protein
VPTVAVGARFLLVVAVAGLAATLAPRPARAQERDNAAVGKITLLNRKAVEAYQQLEFETAVHLLNEALDRSERAGLMNHSLRARTYVTLGIVTLGGLKQRAQALEYFRNALQIQPDVKLNPGLANPEIRAAFEEAASSLASGGGDELTPEKALVHEPVRAGRAGQPLSIAVVPDKSLDARALVLRYRTATDPAFTDVPMQKGPAGSFEAAIPAAATAGREVAYVIEARRPNGSVLVARGSAAHPLIVALASTAGPAGATTAHASTERAAPARLYFALLGGTGFGTTSGTGEETRNNVLSSGVDWTPAGHLAPELGIFVTPRVMVGVQARLQMVSGATPYHVPNPAAGECGSDHICSPSSGAVAGLLKATWLLAEPESAFQPYLSLSAGAGTIRHVSKVSSPATCGSMGNQPCMDTVAGGPALFGPGLGFRYRVSSAVGLVGEIGGLVGMPDFTANADVNVGVAFQL